MSNPLPGQRKRWVLRLHIRLAYEPMLRRRIKITFEIKPIWTRG